MLIEIIFVFVYIQGLTFKAPVTELTEFTNRVDLGEIAHNEPPYLGTVSYLVFIYSFFNEILQMESLSSTFFGTLSFSHVYIFIVIYGARFDCHRHFINTMCLK